MSGIRRSGPYVRHATPEPFWLIAFRLTEDIGETTAGEATAHRMRWDPTANDGDGDYEETEEEITVRDTLEIFADGVEGEHGFYRVRHSTNGIVREIVQLSCP